MVLGFAMLVEGPPVLVFGRARLVDRGAMLIASTDGFDASAALLLAKIAPLACNRERCGSEPN